MSKGSNGTKKRDSGRMAGGFVAMPWAVLDSAAYAGLSHPAKALLQEMARQYVRDNNGRLLLSFAYLSKRGWNSRDVITRGKKELIEAGFIHQTVMGHRPNKASWYAITWWPLDKLKGYDSGAEESFRRGAFMDGTPLQPAKTREQIYRKWDGPGMGRATGKNTSLSPPDGLGEAFIVPPRGLETNPVVPPHGTVGPNIDQLPRPSGGHHLEKPSALAVQSDAASSTNQPGIHRVGQSERLQLAVNCQQSAIERHQRTSVQVVQHDGVTRVRDEYTHDLSVWE